MVTLQEETLVDNKGDSLEAFLIGTLSESLGVVAVSSLVRLTGGANRETWSFDAVDAERNISLYKSIAVSYTHLTLPTKA